MKTLRYEDIDDYLKIVFDAFYEKIGPLYGNQREGAYYIIKAEIIDNLDAGKYLNAVYNEKMLGIIEIVTSENSKNFKKSFLSSSPFTDIPPLLVLQDNKIAVVRK